MVGRIIRMTPELQDPLSRENFLALNASFPWAGWLAAHPTWQHNETRRYRFAMVLDSGVLLKTYTVGFLFRLLWIVETIQPLMAAKGIEVPVFYEGLGHAWNGKILSAMDHGGVYTEQTIVLCSPQHRDTYLLHAAIHELAHCRPSHERDTSVEDYLWHREDFRARHGLILYDFLATEKTLNPSQRRCLRSYAMEDDQAPPIHPGPEPGWNFEGKQWLLLPHPIFDPPVWSREDW